MDNLEINNNKEKLDLDMIIDFLQNESYWAKNRSKEQIIESINNSDCIGVYKESKQIGFARIITDHSTFYYLADVFILNKYQNQGIGHKLMSYINNYKNIKNMRGILTTQTAHQFYNQFGFTRDDDIIRKRIMVKPPQKD